MTEVLARFTPQRGKLVVMFLGLLMFTGFAAYILLEAEPEALGLIRYAAWAAVVFCPVYAVDMAVRIVRRTPTVVATEQGLVLRSILGFSAPIPWAEIGEFRQVIMGKRPWLAVYLEDPRATFGRMDFGSRLMHARSHAAGVPNLTFRAIQLGVSPDEAAKELERIRKGRKAR